MRLREFFAEFPLGFAPLAMIALLIVSAPLSLRRPRQRQPGDCVFWLFAKTHNDEYQARLSDFVRAFPGHRLVISLNSGNVMRDKLLAAFLCQTGAPDLAEIEISSVSRFFAGRPGDCGFLDLKPYLERDGLYDAVVTARYSAWSNRGRIYGIPHDIHPVVLVYRYDLTEPFGDLPAQAPTWDDFVRFFRQPGLLDRNGDGKQDRYALILDRVGNFSARCLALQQDEGLFNEKGEVVFDGPGHRWAFDFIRSCLYETRIAKDGAPGGQDLFSALDEGEAICAICPDWLIGVMARDYPQLAGRLKGMLLPAVTPGGRRTSTVGGTMIGITKQCQDPQLAWDAVKFLYYNDEALANRFRKTRILPPVKSSWRLPVFFQSDGFLASPPLGQLFIEASDVPQFFNHRYGAEAAEQEAKACSVGIAASRAKGYETLRRAAERVRELVRKDRFAAAPEDS